MHKTSASKWVAYLCILHSHYLCEFHILLYAISAEWKGCSCSDSQCCSSSLHFGWLSSNIFTCQTSERGKFFSFTFAFNTE